MMIHSVFYCATRSLLVFRLCFIGWFFSKSHLCIVNFWIFYLPKIFGYTIYSTYSTTVVFSFIDFISPNFILSNFQPHNHIIMCLHTIAYNLGYLRKPRCSNRWLCDNLNEKIYIKVLKAVNQRGLNLSVWMQDNALCCHPIHIDWQSMKFI